MQQKIPSGTSVDRVNSGGGGDDAFLESSGTNAIILDSLGDDILVGSDSIFEIAQIVLATNSSRNMLLNFWYSSN